MRPIWLNGWVFVYELSGCGFESPCSRYLTCFFQDFYFLMMTVRMFIKMENRWTPYSAREYRGLKKANSCLPCCYSFCSYILFCKQQREEKRVQEWSFTNQQVIDVSSLNAFIPERSNNFYLKKSKRKLPPCLLWLETWYGRGKRIGVQVIPKSPAEFFKQQRSELTLSYLWWPSKVSDEIITKIKSILHNLRVNDSWWAITRKTYHNW